MVGRIYRALQCTQHIASKRHPAPSLTVTLYNVTGEKIADELSIPVDTGYEGGIMVTSKFYESFLIGELPRDLWRTYRTLAGTIIMRASRAVVEVANLRLETFVETPLYGEGKMLIGREVLNELTIIMDGKRKETCIAAD